MSGNERDLKNVLDRLEASTRKVVETRGYAKDAKNLKLLEEMIREQLNNANTRRTARSIR